MCFLGAAFTLFLVVSEAPGTYCMSVLFGVVIALVIACGGVVYGDCLSSLRG